MKRFLTIALLFPFSLAAQTFTVGSTTQQLNPSQRGSVATFWPDGTMGAINHSGTNYVFAPVANSNGSGTEQITLPNLNTWSSGLSIVNPSSNFTLGPTNSWNQHYSAGQATYYDSGSGYLIQLIHGEQHFCSPAPCGGSPSYSALGLGYSTDFGNTWHLLGEVVSPQSAWTNGGTNCQADVSMGTLLVVGSYFYVYYDDTGTGCTPGEQLAVARAPISSVIAAAVAGTPFTSGAGTLFMKYTGGGGWTGNGVTNLASPQNGGGAYAQISTDPNGQGIYMPSVRYSSYLNQYVLAYTNFYDVVLQTSSDGLTWGNSQNIKTGGAVPPGAYFYSTLFNTSGGDPQVLGQNFSVFYVYPFGTWSNSSLYSVAISTSGATTYTLSTATAGSGSGTVSGCAGSYTAGASYSCTVTPAGGSTLASVTGCGGSGTTTYAGSMPASNCTVTATFLTSGGSCGGSSPYTAGTNGYADVNSCINGPGHTAVNGDVIQIPCSGTQSVTWTSQLRINASITLTALGASPNTGPLTFGAGTNCLTIVDDAVGNWMFYLTPTYAATNNITTIQNINIDPLTSSTALYTPIAMEGTATASGFPQVRIDNIVFGNGTQWNESGNGSTSAYMIIQDNVIGVADHNTIPAGSSVSLATTNFSSWLGVGQYGDNSWAQPDSMGTANEWYEENNLFNSTLYYQLSDGTENGPSFTESGGGRIVNRFNHLITNDSFGITGVHGLDSTGRPRSGRHTETYGNTLSCANSGGNCQAAASFRGGTGIVFGNTITSSLLTGMFNSTHYNYSLGNVPFGFCGGLNTASGGSISQPYAGDPWDTVDNVVYYTGTMTTSGSGVLTMTDSSKSFPNLAPSGAPYSVYDTTQGFVSQVVSNTSTSITVIQLIDEPTSGFNNGDSYKIIRATVCVDQGGRGAGIYVSGNSPTPVSPMDEALDPIYEWDDKLIGGSIGSNFTQNYSGGLLANRDYYTDSWGGALSGPTAQTSATAPFNGSTTCNAGSGNYTCGVGFGTLALRPTTCTTDVGYWATDQGSWNTSGNSFGQGVLYKCTATNTWTASYTPYMYPHPLAGGPSGVSLTVTTGGSGTGNITGTDCLTNSYASGTAIGPCTATATGGSTFTGWSSSGSASCSGTGTCPASGPFSLTAATVLTATFTPGTSTCGNPFQNGPNYSGTYTVPPTILPIAIGFTSPTSGCTMVMTLDGTVPSATCVIGGSTQAYADQSVSATITMIVRACQAGYTPSTNTGGTWTIITPPAPPTSVNANLQGANIQ